MSVEPRRALHHPVVVRVRSHLVESSGIRLRVIAGIVLCGALGGSIGAVYLVVLDAVQQLIGPGGWAAAAHVPVLVMVGITVAGLVRLLGRPADVELLVDNIHVPDGSHGKEARLRSLVPISLLCIGAGGTLGPEAPLVTTTGTIAHRQAHRAGLSPSDMRILTITGMAAGFAVLFGAPLGGAVFALEIPHRRGIGYHEAAVPPSPPCSSLLPPNWSVPRSVSPPGGAAGSSSPCSSSASASVARWHRTCRVPHPGRSSSG